MDGMNPKKIIFSQLNVSEVNLCSEIQKMLKLERAFVRSSKPLVLLQKVLL